MRSVIHVSSVSREYDIHIGAGILNEIGDLIQALDIQRNKTGNKCLIVSNPVIYRHYGKHLADSLAKNGMEVSSCLIPAGEKFKTLELVQKIYDTAIAQRYDRTSTFIALGGGIVGDITGFAAATCLRGLNFIQVPTSLLAMVDSSVGGKTGVNHPMGKNWIGAFYQPRLVIIDPNVLKTLPTPEYRAGLAEVIKYGVISDRDLFYELSQMSYLSDVNQITEEEIQKIIVRSCEAKAKIVSQDEREHGVRALLNYGHTIGHALESVTQYLRYRHGEAVALGMIAAGQIATELGWWSQDEASQQRQLIRNAGLPIQIADDVSVDDVLTSIQFDKKIINGKTRWILPHKIGLAEITDDVPKHLVRVAIENLKQVKHSSTFVGAI